MAFNPTTIAGFDVYPSQVVPSSELVGGSVKRSASGKAYRKIIAEKGLLLLSWEAATADERAALRAIWTQALQGSVTIVNADFGLSGTYVLADPGFNFKPSEGDPNPALWAGSLTFHEV